MALIFISLLSWVTTRAITTEFDTYLSQNSPLKIPSYPFSPRPRSGRGSVYLIAATAFFLHPTAFNGARAPLEKYSSLLTIEELNSRRLCFRESPSEFYLIIRGKESSLDMLLDLLGFRASVFGEHFVVRHLSVRQNASEKVGTGEVLEPSATDTILSVKAILLTIKSLCYCCVI